MTTPSTLRRTALAMTILVAVALIAHHTTAGATQVATPQASAPTPFKPVARVSSLMSAHGMAFHQLGESFPKADPEERHGSIARWADVLAELSNVHTRHRREPESLDMAGTTLSLAKDLAREARAEDPDAARMRELYTAIDTSCATCHEAG